MTRVLALLAAIALVVGAVVVRNAIDDDGTSTRDGGASTHVVCATELADACNALGTGRYDVVVEDAAATADRLSTDADVDDDVWIVEEPWPAIVDDARVRGGLPARFDSAAAPLARSPLVALGSGIDGCDWRCLGDGDGTLGAPALASGLGALELGAATAGYFGRSDFAANDFDPAFRSWLSGLTARVRPTDRPVTRLLQSRAFFDIALSFEAEARAELDPASADRKAGLALQYPAPVAYLDAVAVGVDGTTVAGDLISSMQRALHDEGWQEAATTANGLPKAGVLVALRELL